MLSIWGRPSSVNVQKVLWAADELGLTYEHIVVGGKFGGTDGAAYGALNPNRLVPSIQDDPETPGGAPVTIWESNSITRYLAARYGAGTLWPALPGQRSEADRWMDWALTIIGEPLRVLFWGFIRDPAHAVPEAMQQAEAQAAQYWARLDAHLADRAYVAGDAFSMGDIPVGCFVQRWLNFPITRPSLPHLEAWHERLSQRPAYAKHVMVRME
ncbi:MAG: glutathione S-transferase [Ferrovibrio sp.]|nr:glutathione S-transferase [Ferrovibrio sp.]